MSQYTPDTGSVRACYLSTHTAASGERVRDEAARSFDRWFDQVLAEARREGQADGWDEGEADGRHNASEHRPGMKITNPYTED